MGHSERVVDANIRARERREWVELMRKHTPESLTRQEVAVADVPLTKAPHPQPVTAWVRYAGHPVQVKGFTSMWTQSAAKIRWTVPQGGWHEAWVWAGAFEPRRMERSEENMGRLGLSINGPQE